ncbi:hypothetical protein KDH_30140 [Dictyobacter sp. S3.2.2.5]|uniref:Uncharacterized protein n=1 Tax=Dictyobacter halimunensis TaxID=3026934 RepID=A0ABQ6FS94_9CHLR|nr:hypothetical protein KDH_30140 [Dictyobacter sp. S3.2.2.5]
MRGQEKKNNPQKSLKISAANAQDAISSGATGCTTTNGILSIGLALVVVGTRECPRTRVRIVIL